MKTTLLILALLLSLQTVRAQNALNTSVEVGSPVSDFDVMTFAGPVGIDGFRGKTVVIITGARCVDPASPRCPGSTRWSRYGNRPDLVFLAISVDSRDELKRFLEERPFKYIQTFATDSVNKLFGGALPQHRPFATP